MHTLPKDFGGDLPTLVFRSHLCDRPLHSDMTVSGHLFSKTTFDDIIVRRPIMPLAPETRLSSNAGFKLRLT